MDKIIIARLGKAMATALCCALLTACGKGEAKYRIGVSQCSEDIWREKLNSELRMGAYAHEDVELLFASADDSDERQVEQIDSFVAAGIDLLIVAPNQMATISPAIDRAYDKGIPVIVYERKTSSQKFTAYMGGDNRLMGRQMGEYVARRLGGQGRVVEVMGLQGSSPAIERHEGFAEALSRFPGIELVASLQGDWTEQSGYEAMKNCMNGPTTNESTNSNAGNIDLVFGQNDRMAIGARRAMMEFLSTAQSLPLFCGIDGLPGEDGGIASVRDSVMEASYIYPTHGDEVLDLALDILEGRDFKTDNPLQGTLVTHENARALLLQAEEIGRQTRQIDNLHALANTYSTRLTQQRLFTALALTAALLLFIVLLLFYLYHRNKENMRRERVVQNLWNMESRTPDPAPVGEGGEATFITRFREAVEKRMADSELSVEDLAADMNLSRVQLYRRVKTLTGSSPVELLRTARLNRAYQLLLTSDRSVSEVAYAVGFSAPAYFTKCFKEEFGKNPSELK